MKRNTCIFCVLLASTTGCGEDRPPPREGSGPDLTNEPPAGHSGNAATLSDGGTPDMASPDAGSGGPDAGASTGVIRDLAGDTCVPTTALPVAMLEAGPRGLTFDHAGVMGDRRFAFDSGTLAFLTFAADGSATAEPPAGDVVAVAGTPAGLSALTIDTAGGLLLSFFDTFGAVAAPSIELDGPRTDSHALAVGPQSTLAVWSTDTELKGIMITPDGVKSEPIEFGAQSCGEYGCKPVVLSGASNFTVLWSRVRHDGLSMLTWAALGTDGSIINAKAVLASRKFYQLADATLLDEQSIALVLTEGFPPEAPVLVFLSPFGNVQGPAQRLLGAVEAWSIASHGSSVAIAARSDEEQAVFRAFTSSGEASSPWSCLDDSEKNSAFSPQAALFADGAGYGLLVRHTNGSAAYLSTDAVE